jgi:hypothetical protein
MDALLEAIEMRETRNQLVSSSTPTRTSDVNNRDDSGFSGAFVN